MEPHADRPGEYSAHVGEGTDNSQRDAPHVPVLSDAVLELAGAEAASTIIDGTFGAGGHARLLADAMPDGGHYIAIDRDPVARTHFEAVSAAFPQHAWVLLPVTFAEGLERLAREDVSADIVILDVGVSSMQIDEQERGFSYVQDAPLDMRMDPTAGAPARDLVNSLSVTDLERILREYGDERHARRIARAIAAARETAAIETTGQLATIVDDAVPAARRRRGHPAKRTFQALRIAVNDELGQLDRGLDAALAALRPGGRLLVITFHSLEDRMVKQRFAAWTTDCTCPPDFPVCTCDTIPVAHDLERRGRTAPDDELAANPRAASARLRAVTRAEVAA